MILIKGRKADLFITTNPPLGVFLPCVVRNHFTLLVYDIYPDVIVEYGILSKDSLIVKSWERINEKVFSRADRVITIGRGMQERLSRYISSDKIEVIPCWTHSDFLFPVAKADNAFIKEHHLEGKFLVIYSGNLGVTHDIEVMIELAQRTRRDNLHFMIIGEGEKRKSLIRQVEERNLRNVTILPWQDVAMLPYSLSAADLAVVTLGKGASLLSVPSKLYDVMAVGSPLLAIAENDSEMKAIIDSYSIGASFPSVGVEDMLSFIYKVMDDKQYHATLRSNSLQASRDFTSANAAGFAR